MSVRKRFTDADLEKIRKAAREAEERTSGELVVYIVGRVDDHDEAAWKGAALGALAVAVAAGAAHWLTGQWGGSAIFWMSLPAFAGAAGGYLLTTLVPAFGRWLIPADSLERRVRMRAESAFLTEEVFATRERTGILVFLALFEHRAVILADSGIRARVAPGEWRRLVTDLVGGIEAGRTVLAVVETLRRCGDLLERHGVERRDDDENELANEPRVLER